MIFVTPSSSPFFLKMYSLGVNLASSFFLFTNLFKNYKGQKDLNLHTKNQCFNLIRFIF